MSFSAVENGTVVAGLNDSLFMVSAASFVSALSECLLMTRATVCGASCGVLGEMGR